MHIIKILKIPKLTIKKMKRARRQQLTSVILATQEAEIRRISVQVTFKQIVFETLSRKNPSQKKGWWSGSRGKKPAYQV
jgi:hypothetical protein